MDIVNDNVNHPSHYTQGGIECLDAIEASMPAEGFQDYCKGNILKYIWRYRFKNGVEDLKKAQFYLDRMIQSVENMTEVRLPNGGVIFTDGSDIETGGIK